MLAQKNNFEFFSGKFSLFTVKFSKKIATPEGNFYQFQIWNEIVLSLRLGFNFVEKLRIPFMFCIFSQASENCEQKCKINKTNYACFNFRHKHKTMKTCKNAFWKPYFFVEWNFLKLLICGIDCYSIFIRWYFYFDFDI